MLVVFKSTSNARLAGEARSRRQLLSAFFTPKANHSRHEHICDTFKRPSQSSQTPCATCSLRRGGFGGAAVGRAFKGFAHIDA